MAVDIPPALLCVPEGGSRIHSLKSITMALVATYPGQFSQSDIAALTGATFSNVSTSATRLDKGLGWLVRSRRHDGQPHGQFYRLEPSDIFWQDRASAAGAASRLDGYAEAVAAFKADIQQSPDTQESGNPVEARKQWLGSIARLGATYDLSRGRTWLKGAGGWNLLVRTSLLSLITPPASQSFD